MRRVLGHQVWLKAALAATVAFAAGCPATSTPTSSKGSGAKDVAEKKEEGLPDKAEDVAALKASGASVEMDPAGHVVKVQLDQDSGGDKQLAHLKGLPNVRDLGADARGVTNDGLALLV